MKIKTLEVDVVADITEEGIWCATYIGEAGDPSAECTITWEDWQAQQIESCTVPNSSMVPYQKPEDIEALFDIVHILREQANKLERNLFSLHAFDRKAWVDANLGTFDNAIPPDRFLTPMTEFVERFKK